MTGLSSGFLLFLSLWQTSSSLLEKDFQDHLTPSIFHLADHISLHREKRAAADDASYYEAAIEISFSDPSLAAVYANVLQNKDVYASLPDTIQISNVDVAPACTFNGSYANCSCSKEYDCLGTLGPCVNGTCICITTLPLQKYCLARTNITISPVTIFQGDTVTIDCRFGELGSISWYLNAKKIPADPRYNASSSWQGTMVLYTLKIRNVTDADKGNYTCSLAASGAPQNLSKTIIQIQTLQIQSLSTVDKFCNDPAFSLTCCSVSIGDFIVTWTLSPSGIQGTVTSSETCSIYTLTPNVTHFCPSVTNYNCIFHRNEGATDSRITQVNYIQRASITIPPSFSISIGRSRSVDCRSSISDASTSIAWAKGTPSNIVFQNTGFSINSASSAWAGTYFCVVTQRSLTTFANLTVDVIFLPKQEEIKVSPLTSFTTKCSDNPTKLSCCVNGIGYRRVFNTDNTLTPVADPDPNCYSATVTFDCTVKPKITVTCVVYNSQNDNVTSDVMTVTYFKENVEGLKNCKAENGRPATPNGFIYSEACQTLNQTLLGTKNYTCKDGEWEPAVDGCYSVKIFQQLENVKDILKGPEVQQNLPSLLKNLTVTATEEKQNIQDSTKSLQVMVEIISTVSNATVAVEQTMMQNFIKTVDVVVDKSSAWDRAGNESVTILNSVENFAKKLEFNGTIDFKNESISNIQLYGQILSKDDNYSKVFDVQNLSGNVFIDRGSFPDNSTTVITIAYGTMKDILPKNTNNASKIVNGLVMSTIVRGNSSMNSNSNVFKINMSFTESNTSLAKPECVWLNTTQNVWNNSGCDLLGENGTITCSCNHLTSFSILMGEPDIKNPNPNSNPDPYSELITYIGVGISLACLVITLLIEALVWASVIKNKTSYVRHVCLVNIAVTLLVANIWFIIGAALEKAKGSAACKAAAFFIFFFYLSLFFWMLTTGLILFYRLIYILHDMSRKTMMIIAFLLGYGCPLLITVVTVASTEPSNRFTSNQFCWLDYKNSRSFLAFVVPALTIVFVNMLILVVVIFKLMRPTIGEKSGKEDRKTLVVIAKTIAILTPLLGSTWGVGLGVAIEPSNTVLSIIFSALNSFQGLFILISTVLLDQKVRTAVRSSISSSYWRTIRSRGQTTSTDSSGTSKTKSKTKKNPFQKAFFGKKAVYHLYSNQSSTETSGNSFSVLS